MKNSAKSLSCEGKISMKTERNRNRTSGWCLCVLLAVAVALACQPSAAAPENNSADKALQRVQAKQDYKAKTMLDKGLDLLADRQEERGLKLIASIPRMFPTSKIRFKAYLDLGKYYLSKRRLGLAVRNFRQVEKSKDPQQRAEAVYQIGICYFRQNRFAKAFTALRKVTNEYPWSVYANEAYYYIGQCHFKMGQWSKAIEALEMVGTSVPANVKGVAFAEAGQRLYVKVTDKDLSVRLGPTGTFKLNVQAKSGDTEQVEMAPLGRLKGNYIGSVRTQAGGAKNADGVLQFIGGDTITVSYIDQNTESGDMNRKLVTNVKLVSSAAIGFTDGAYREYVEGAFGERDCFVRVRDLDRDVSKGRDKISVKVSSEYKVPAPEAADEEKSPHEAKKTRLRDTVTLTLTETGPHTGIFVGSFVPKVAANQAAVRQGDAALSAIKDDELVLEYIDTAHIHGRDPRKLTGRVKLLLGQIQDVKIEHRVVNDRQLKARKNLIEAKILLKLGNVFKDVGLNKKAYEKAKEGLEKINEVISTSVKADLNRSILEQAFQVKWELLLVQDKLREAIGVCSTLTRLYPDSALVDDALFKIAAAKLQAKEYNQALSIFSEITRLPSSEMKAEAQFNVAVIHEMTARKQAGTRRPELSKALLAYKKCAETYPDSPFADKSLEKIANYYITTKDYARAIELMERVCQDYPDADFLDRMLLKWIIAAYRMGNYKLAKQKAEQLIAEYPDSKLAPKARNFLKAIESNL